jgi:hypothetical protein
MKRNPMMAQQSQHALRVGRAIDFPRIRAKAKPRTSSSKSRITVEAKRRTSSSKSRIRVKAKRRTSYSSSSSSSSSSLSLSAAVPNPPLHRQQLLS